MTSRLIQNVTASKNPQQQDLLSDGKSADELLQETINLPAEDIEAIEEESITDNQLYKGITFSANLDAKLKNEVAIFYVVDEDGQYRVRAFNAVQRMLDTGSNQPPIVSFSQQMEGENSSEKLRDIPAVMRLYSQKRREAKQIIKWLVELQKRLTYDQQELSYVVINDKTDFEIPWEMLEWHIKSESDEKIHHYLGASFITVRWQDIENLECWGEDENLLNLEFDSPGISVAAILRNIRKQIAEIYKERKDDETERLFIITFMYVYYGNPMTVLRLPKTGGG